MPKPTYRIKLYGQSDDNPDKFAREMAALLAIDLDTAKDFLLNTPVVIREGLERATAEKLVEMLRSKRGLCLMESENGGHSDGARDKEEAPPAGGPAEADAKSSVYSKVAMASLGGLAVILAVYLWFGLFSTIRRVKEQSVPPAPPKIEIQSEDPAAQPSASGERLQAEQQADDRVRELETQINDLRVRLASTEQYLTSQRRTTNRNEAEFQSRTEQASQLRKEIFTLNHELQTLKANLLRVRGY